MEKEIVVPPKRHQIDLSTGVSSKCNSMNDFSRKVYQKTRRSKQQRELSGVGFKPASSQKTRDVSTNKNIQYKTSLKSKVKGSAKPIVQSQSSYSNLKNSNKYMDTSSDK